MHCHPRIVHAAVMAWARSSVLTRTITGRFSDPSFAMKFASQLTTTVVGDAFAVGPQSTQ
jgi:hypothetical protein